MVRARQAQQVAVLVGPVHDHFDLGGRVCGGVPAAEGFEVCWEGDEDGAPVGEDWVGMSVIYCFFLVEMGKGGAWEVCMLLLRLLEGGVWKGGTSRTELGGLLAPGRGRGG